MAKQANATERHRSKRTSRKLTLLLGCMAVVHWFDGLLTLIDKAVDVWNKVRDLF